MTAHQALALREVGNGGHPVGFTPACRCGWSAPTAHVWEFGPIEARTRAMIDAQAHVRQAEAREGVASEPAPLDLGARPRQCPAMMGTTRCIHAEGHQGSHYGVQAVEWGGDLRDRLGRPPTGDEAARGGDFT